MAHDAESFAGNADVELVGESSVDLLVDKQLGAAEDSSGSNAAVEQAVAYSIT